MRRRLIAAPDDALKIDRQGASSGVRRWRMSTLTTRLPWRRPEAAFLALILRKPRVALERLGVVVAPLAAEGQRQLDGFVGLGALHGLAGRGVALGRRVLLRVTFAPLDRYTPAPW